MNAFSQKWGLVAALLLVAAPSVFAQPLDKDQKREILVAIEDVLNRRAFVPGVDFAKWPEYVSKRRDFIDLSDSVRSFTTNINRALREFGVSHCRVEFGSESLVGLAAQTRSQEPAVSTLEWLDEKTAVIRIRTFGKEYLRTDVAKLVDEARTGDRLILDLRSNGGGLVDNLQHLLGLLLPPETAVGTFVTRRTASAFESATGGNPTDLAAIADWTKSKLRTRGLGPKPYEGKIAVVVNRGTGSASEMAAAALRDLLKAPVVGTPTAGAVLGSTFATLPHGFRLQYPAQDYVTIKGQRLEGHPVVPDYEVRTRGVGSRDPALEKAAEVLGGGRFRYN